MSELVYGTIQQQASTEAVCKFGYVPLLEYWACLGSQWCAILRMQNGYENKVIEVDAFSEMPINCRALQKHASPQIFCVYWILTCLYRWSCGRQGWENSPANHTNIPANSCLWFLSSTKANSCLFPWDCNLNPERNRTFENTWNISKGYRRVHQDLFQDGEIQRRWVASQFRLPVTSALHWNRAMPKNKLHQSCSLSRKSFTGF